MGNRGGSGETEESVWAAARQLAQRVPGGVADQFESHSRRYVAELGRWTRAGRLTGYRSGGERVRELIGGSLVFLMAAPEIEPPLVDVGTGPGVPGLILKFARPAWDVTLIEARRRRANFLRHMVRVLELRGVEIVEDRAEAQAVRTRLSGQFRAVTLRAVARVADAIQLARPLAAPGARVIIGLGPGAIGQDGGGTVRAVQGSPLLGRRRFLIIIAPEVEPAREGVPRGT